ncbi:MAG: hypothetical protein QXO25_06385 [Candidatus Bathyarchaeia archaeon]
MIAKGVANLESVRRALEHGIVVLSRSTTNAYVYEEITGRRLDRAKYSCGVITDNGTCISESVSDRSYRTFVFIDGEATQPENQEEFSIIMSRMDRGDIFIKSANTLDPYGAAATLVGDPAGGEVAQLRSVLDKKVELIVPVTVSKTIPYPIDKVKGVCSIKGVERSMGMPVSLLPLPGIVVTEPEALNRLTGTEAVPICALDSEGKGAVTLVIIGPPKQVENAWRLLSLIKGESPVTVERNPCRICPATTCTSSGLRKEG